MKFILTILSIFSVATAQIKADGKTDDLAALQEFAKTGGILPPGRIVISNTLEIGKIFLKDYTNPEPTAIDPVPYQNAKFTRPVVIEGNPMGTTIVLINPDTTLPVIAYNAQGLQYDNRSGEIKNLTLIGNGVGISSAYTQRLRITNVNFKGFKTGLLLNNCYYLNAQNLYFEKCNRAEYDTRSHNNTFINIAVYDCNKGFEVRSNKVGIYGYTAMRCYTGLHIAGSVNTIDRVVLETNKPTAQLIIGDTAGVKINGNTFINLTISAPNMKAIRFEKTCGFLSILGGQIQSTNFEIIGMPQVEVKNLIGALPKEIVKL